MTEDNAKSKLTLSGKKTLTLKNLSDARPAGDGKKVVQVEVRKKRVINPAAPAGKEVKIDEATAALEAGTLHVFDTSTFTVEGETLTSAFALDTDGDFTPDAEEAVFDGAFHESYFQSAPYFTLQIDGIEWLNSAYGNYCLLYTSDAADEL